MLRLDAERGAAPTVGMTVTTVAKRTSADDLRRSIEQVFRALRRRWPDVEYCAFVEWTTGEGTHSGGHRRVHVHFLLKGLATTSCPDAELVLRDVWRARTRAHRVEVRELLKPGGATAYLALHHRKRSQGPPPGHRGFRRLRSSHGYFDRPGRERRQEAREFLADKRFRGAIERRLQEAFVDAGAASWLLDEEEGRQGLHVHAGDLWDEFLEAELEDALERQAFERPVLVRVRHRDVVDELTGEVTRTVDEVLDRA
jgi:hypothetical protein